MKSEATPLCPSARAETEGSQVIGVVRDPAEGPRVVYLKEPVEVTPELLARVEPVRPGQVLRVAATCSESKCQHFDGQDCRLAQRIIAGLPTVVVALPACTIRSSCRWWLQEGKAACLRCPQVVTNPLHPDDHYRQVVNPSHSLSPE